MKWWGRGVFRFFGSLCSLGTLLLVSLIWLGAGPQQAERPPQPFFQDFFSGSVLVDGVPPPVGTGLVACIGSCQNGFQSETYLLYPDGSFDQLEVNPENEDLVVHPIIFYLENDFGRIRAVETRPYIGVFDFYKQNLTFRGPMPAPEPTPVPPLVKQNPSPTPVASLPVAGDPLLAKIPIVVLVLGVLGTLAGVVLIRVARRASP